MQNSISSDSDDYILTYDEYYNYNYMDSYKYETCMFCLSLVTPIIIICIVYLCLNG